MKKIWVLNFEYQGVSKVGGLGEVSANQTRILSNDFDFLVFIPSHGQVERLKKSTNVQKLSISCSGHQKFPFDDRKQKEEEYLISYYQVMIKNVNVILLSGENSFTSKYLDDEIVYNPDTFDGKLCLFSIGMRFYVNHVIKENPKNVPDIVHLHDYHAVIPFLNIKQELNKNHLDVVSIITFHLLTWPHYEIDFYKACGMDETPITILLREGYKSFTLSEIFLFLKQKVLSKEQKVPSVEQVGALISDMVITVSESYLKSDIIPDLGDEIIKFKTNFVWNGCDWDYHELYQEVMQNLGKEMHEILNIPDDKTISRKDMKKYLLTYKIGHLNDSPLITSKKVLEAINEISNGNCFVKNGNIKCFLETGPLVISTGRMSRQKGFETIFEAIPDVLQVIPNAKFLLLILPTEYSIKEIKLYAEYVTKYPGNLRIFFGIAPDIFNLAHISADTYAALSRWEPFGIIALEAMASKLPVIATKIGGLQESIIDVRENIKEGTGQLIPVDNSKKFVDSLISFFILSQIEELNEEGIGIDKIKKEINIEAISNESLKKQVLMNPRFYDEIRENCYKRVKNAFHWEIVCKKLMDLYLELGKQN